MKTAHKRIIYPVISFILPAAILSVVLALNCIYPFGEKSILIYDLRSQYVDFFASLRSGGSIFYTFERAFGGDYFTLAAYYLLSPFNLILFLFPENSLIAALTFIYYAKIMTAGFCMCLYLCRTRLFSLDCRFAPLFASAYCFCGFAVMYAQNLMWLDALWLLPLLARSAETLVAESRSVKFALTLAASLIINFYTGFMLAVFSLLYVVFLQFAMEHDGAGRTFMRYITAAFCGLGISSAVVYTAYNKLAYTKLSDANLLSIAAEGVFAGMKGFFSAAFYVSLVLEIICVFILLRNSRRPPLRAAVKRNTVLIITLLTAAFAAVCVIINYGSFAGSTRKYLPFVYDTEYPQLFCSSVCAILAAIFFIFRKNRGPYAFLIISVSLPAVCMPLDLLLHSGQAPVSFPGRYSFIISFAVILTAAHSLSTIRIDLLRGRVPSAVTLITSVILISELAANAVFAFRYNAGIYYGYLPKAGYDSFIEVNRSALKIAGNNMRTEKTYYRYLNDSMSLGYRGLTHYSSMYRRSFNAAMHSFGYAATEYWTSYFGSTPLLDSLFGVGCLLDMTDADYAARMLIKRYGRSPMQDIYEKTGSTRLIDLYRNPYALPIAYSVNPDFTSSFSYGINPFETQNNLISAMTGEKETVFIRQTATEPEYTGKTAVYELAVSHGGTLYMYIGSGAHIPCRVYVNGMLYTDYQTSQAAVPYTVYLGLHKKGDTVTIGLEPIGTELDYDSIDFYILKNEYADVIKEIAGYNGAAAEAGGNKIKIISRKGDTVFTSIPYEEGWRVTGGTADIIECGGFMCVELDADNDIAELVYIPPGLPRGCIISAGGIILLIIIIIKERKRQ